eukprot:2901542-Rhodomonas_salina.2
MIPLWLVVPPLSSYAYSMQCPVLKLTSYTGTIPAILLRTRYAWSSTGVAMSGPDVPYAATRQCVGMSLALSGVAAIGGVPPSLMSYAFSIWSVVLTWRMLLRLLLGPGFTAARGRVHATSRAMSGTWYALSGTGKGCYAMSGIDIGCCAVSGTELYAGARWWRRRAERGRSVLW